jgi:hypothetical protein
LLNHVHTTADLIRGFHDIVCSLAHAGWYRVLFPACVSDGVGVEGGFVGIIPIRTFGIGQGVRSPICVISGVRVRQSVSAIFLFGIFVSQGGALAILGRS